MKTPSSHYDQNGTDNQSIAYDVCGVCGQCVYARARAHRCRSQADHSLRAILSDSCLSSSK